MSVKRPCRWMDRLLRPHLEGELEPDEAARVREHLSRCAACARQAAAFRGVLQAASTLPVGEMRPDFAERLHARLAAERGRALSPWQRLVDLASSHGRGFPIGLSAAAALALVVAGIFLIPAPRITAEEVTIRVQESWARLQDYHCTLRTDILYRGRPQTMTREQWFRKPDQFRIEASDGQRRTTFITGREVITYLPDARVAIHRPRREDEPDLPFPFRSSVDLQGDITVDAMLAGLAERSDAEMIGQEEILGKECYVLKFRTVKPPTRRVRQARPFDCRMWVDGETFLPLKVRMYCDDRTWSYTRATGLEVNQGLPASTFVPNMPRGVRWLRGDMDPRIFAWKGIHTLRHRIDPVRVARREQRRMAFDVLAPCWLPEGYRVIAAVARHERLKDRIERTLTLTLVNGAGDGITIAQEPAAEATDGDTVSVESGTRPYPYVRLTGVRAGTVVRIMAANLSREDAVRILQELRTRQEKEQGPPPAAEYRPTGTAAVLARLP